MAEGHYPRCGGRDRARLFSLTSWAPQIVAMLFAAASTWPAMALGSNAAADDSGKSDAQLCNSWQITSLTTDPAVDPKKLNEISEQDKVHQAITNGLPEISHVDERAALDKIANQIANGLTNPISASAEELQTRLERAMQAACNALASGASRQSALVIALKAGPFLIPATTSSSYVLFLGAVNSLNAKGGFSSQGGAEFLSRTLVSGRRATKDERQNALPCLFFSASNESSNTTKESNNAPKNQTTKRDCVFRHDVPALDGPTLDAVFELNYARIGALTSDTSTPPAASTTPPTRRIAAVGTDTTVTPQSPFSSSSGILRGNLSLEYTFNHQYVGVTGGVGFTSRTSSVAGANTHLSPRFYTGLLFLADYGSTDNSEHTTGRVILAYARDRFWQPADASDTTSPDHPDRVVLDARLDTPGVFNSEKVKLSFQIFVDAPTSAHGPADVRFSILISTDLQKLLGAT